MLFWACFAALVATSFGFIIRALIIGDWATAYNLSETEKGEIFGVGLWPFAISIVLLSQVTAGVMILVAATVYGLGKTFFWPTILGVVDEQFPRGGALTLNAIGGVGMLGVGIVGAALLGNIQDKAIDKTLASENAALHAQVVGEEQVSVYQPLDRDKVAKTSKKEQEAIEDIENKAKKGALKTVAIFPVIMFACFMILIVYFRSKGGYKAVDITHET